LVNGVGIVQATLDGVHEGTEVGGVLGIQALLFDELPQSLDEIEIGGVRGEEQPLDVKFLGVRFDEFAAGITGIVQDDRDGQVQRQGRQLVEPLADAQGIDISGMGHRNDLFGHGIECAQDVEALATGGRPDPDPRKAPKHRHEGTEDKVRGVYKEDGALAGLGLRQTWFEVVFLKVSWASGSALAGKVPVFRRFRPHFSFRKTRTGVGERVKPVKRVMAAPASWMDAGG